MLLNSFLKKGKAVACEPRSFEHISYDDFTVTSSHPVDASLLDAPMLEHELPGRLGLHPLPDDAVLLFHEGKTSASRLRKLIQEETVSSVAPRATLITVTKTYDSSVESEEEETEEVSEEEGEEELSLDEEKEQEDEHEEEDFAKGDEKDAKDEYEDSDEDTPR
jgi:hypothetical protein